MIDPNTICQECSHTIHEGSCNTRLMGGGVCQCDTQSHDIEDTSDAKLMLDIEQCFGIMDINNLKVDSPATSYAVAGVNDKRLTPRFLGVCVFYLTLIWYQPQTQIPKS